MTNADPKEVDAVVQVIGKAVDTVDPVATPIVSFIEEIIEEIVDVVEGK